MDTDENKLEKLSRNVPAAFTLLETVEIIAPAVDRKVMVVAALVLPAFWIVSTGKSELVKRSKGR